MSCKKCVDVYFLVGANGSALVWLAIFVNLFMHEVVDGASKHPLINNYVLTLNNMLTGGELIQCVKK